VDLARIKVDLDGRIDQLMLLDQALADELLGFDADGEMISPRPHEVVDGCSAARQGCFN